MVPMGGEQTDSESQADQQQCDEQGRLQRGQFEVASENFEVNRNDGSYDSDYLENKVNSCYVVEIHLRIGQRWPERGSAASD